MDNTELHYIAYDPDEIWLDMVQNYIDNGGDILYPGDEKEMLLRGVQANIVQIYAAVDNALRMQTLRYAVGEYLDVFGENRGCSRIAAETATASVEIRTIALGVTRVIPAGTVLTADGKALYALEDDISLNGFAQVIGARVVALEAGITGNGLNNGRKMYFVEPLECIETVTCTSDATGGREAETDDEYRERIRTYGLTSTTTGTKTRYEAAAKEVSTDILDAKAINTGVAEVTIYLITADDAKSDYLTEVLDALNKRDARPLTDRVLTATAEAIPYTLTVNYSVDNSTDAETKIAAAVKEYQAWQDNVIGQTFNPDRLMALMYQAGATLVTWDTANSNFNGSGEIKYTEIAADKRCKGTINLSKS